MYREALGLVQPGIEFEFVASGGFCAPLSPLYQLHTIPAEELLSIPATLLSPVREALPSFTARRGVKP